MRAFSAPTRVGQAGRAIPGATVLYGPSSEGKTYLIETMAKYLGLHSYDFHNPHDEKANYLHINCLNVVEGTATENQLNVSD